MEAEVGRAAPEVVRQRAVRLAQALCTDAHLYGGHACLSCQNAARLLVTTFDEVDLRDGGEDDGWTIDIAPPLHGTSHKTAESHWARLLSSVVRSPDSSEPPSAGAPPE